MRWHKESPKPGAGTGRLGGEEGLEDVLEIIGRDPDAVVDNTHYHPAVLVGAEIVFGHHFDLAVAALGGVGGVEQQI